jgi:hypothetical protein
MIFDIIATLMPMLPPSENEAAYENFLTQSFIVISNAPGATSSQDDFLGCLDSFLPILRNEDIQGILAKNFTQCSNLLENCILRLTGRKRLRSKDTPVTEAEEEELETVIAEIAELSTHADELVGILAAVAFLIPFESTADLLNSEDVHDMIRWLSDEWKSDTTPLTNRDSEHINFARAGALVLGNVAKQEWIVKALMETTKIVSAAVDAILGTEDRELLDGSAGLLHNMAIPSTSKVEMQKAGVFGCVSKLLITKKDDQPDAAVCTSGLRLLRVLLLDSPENCNWFLTNPQEATTLENFKLLIQIEDKRDARIRNEAGRALVALLRSLQATATLNVPSRLESDYTTELMFQTPGAIDAILSLTSHPDPRNKSQGWMGLAVVSRMKTGGAQVRKCFARAAKEVPTQFEELLKEKTSPDRPMLDKDKDNALVLMANIMRDMVSAFDFGVEVVY